MGAAARGGVVGMNCVHAYHKEHACCRPKPVWKRGKHIKCFAYDQTYQWVGVRKRGRRQSVERLDASGMPMEIKHMVYINSMEVMLPDGLGNLSAQDLSRIAANHGSAYTEPYNNILLPLQPATIELSLIDFARDVCSSVDQVLASTIVCIQAICACLPMFARTLSHN